MKLHRTRGAAWLAMMLTLIVVFATAAPTLRAEETAASKQAVIAVKGLACPFCVHGLKKHLLRLPGAKQVDVSLGKGEAVVTFEASSRVTEPEIAAAVRKAGFTPGKIEWRTASGS